MDRLVDWLLLLAASFLLIVEQPQTSGPVVAFLVAITVSALHGLKTNRSLTLITLSLYMVATIFWPDFGYFLPLVFYGAFVNCRRQSSYNLIFLALLSLLPIITRLPAQSVALLTVFIFISFTLAHRTLLRERQESDNKRLRDDGWETTMLLRAKNQELLEKQDYELQVATLDERARIAREIHDHVGHLLSRSILQIGALLVTVEDEKTKSGLAAVNRTLTGAMDSIRHSIHDLYEDSLDLKTRVKALVHDFSFCPIRLDYNLSAEPAKEIGHSVLAIIKEGLNNVLRHSNATHVDLTLAEHPAFYQLILADNGTKTYGKNKKGLGLKSMADRVQGLGGRLTIRRDGGFRLFISIPKGGGLHEGTDN